MEGWIKLYRKSLENFTFSDPDYLAVWIRLLLKANFEEHSIIFNNQKMLIKSGQLITSRLKIAIESQVQESKVERILKCLENEQQIEQQKFNKFRLITIINWNKYQNNEQQIEQQMNNKRTTSEQPVNTYKNNKKEKKVKNDKKTNNRVSNDTLLERNPNIKIFIDYFYNKFLETTGRKYMVQGGKDGKTVQRLLGTYIIDELKDLCDKFFISTDEFVLKAGFSIGIFNSIVHKIISGDRFSGMSGKELKSYIACQNFIKEKGNNDASK